MLLSATMAGFWAGYAVCALMLWVSKKGEKREPLTVYLINTLLIFLVIQGVNLYTGGR